MYSSSPIHNAVLNLLKSQGFSMQEASIITKAETEYLTCRDRQVVERWNMSRCHSEHAKSVSYVQKYKLIEYLLVLKSSNPSLTQM